MTKARSLSDFIESDGSVTLVDNQKIKIGTGNDLQLYHSGGNSYIDNNKGALFIRNNVDDDDNNNIILQAKSGEYSIICDDDGAVTLYHDNSPKLATTSTGISVTGEIDLSDDINIVDGKAARFGTGEDFSIYNDGSNTYLRNSTSNQDINFLGNDDGSANVTMLTLDASDGGTATFNHDVKLGDNGRVVFGSGSDLEIFYNGSNAFIQNHVGGGLYNRARTDFVVQTNATGGGADDAIKALQNGAVELYYDGSKKLETSSAGITVTGQPTFNVTDQSIKVVNSANAAHGLEIYRGSDGAKGALFGWGNGSANLEIKNFRNDGQSTGPYANIDFHTGGTDADSPDYNPTRRMRIQQTGEVGINVDDPTNQLHVKSNGTGAITGLRLENANTSVGDGPKIMFTSGTSTVGAAIASRGTALNQADLMFFASGDTEKARLSGNNLHLIGGNDARIQLSTSGTGNAAVSNNTVNIRGDNDVLKLNAAGNGAIYMEINGAEKARINDQGIATNWSSSTAGKLSVGGTGSNSVQTFFQHNECMVIAAHSSGANSSDFTITLAFETNHLRGGTVEMESSGHKYNNGGDFWLSRHVYSCMSEGANNRMNSRISGLEFSQGNNRMTTALNKVSGSNRWEAVITIQGEYQGAFHFRLQGYAFVNMPTGLTIAT